MTEERDPQLEALFSSVDAISPNGDFADRVMMGVDGRKRTVLLGRLSLIALIVLLELLLSAPLSGAIGTIANGLSTPIVDLGTGWIASLAAPVNSAAGVVGAVLLLLHFLYRRMVR